VFSAAFTVIVPLPVADALVSVHHAALLAAVHVVLLVTSILYEPAAAVAEIFAGLTERVGVAAACVTVTSRVIDAPLTTTLTVRVSNVVFSATFTVIVPLLFPDVGVTVHHAADAGFTATVHSILLVTAMLYEPEAAVASMLVLSITSEGATPTCTTVTVLVSEPAVTVIVAERRSSNVFSATLTVNVPLPVVRVHHEALLVAVHVVLLATATLYEPAAAVAEIFSGLTASVGVGCGAGLSTSLFEQLLKVTKPARAKIKNKFFFITCYLIVNLLFILSIICLNFDLFDLND
jgi:hypothetical protein